MPKLAANEVIVPGSLALVFDINLEVTGEHANNYLVQNVSRALVDKLIVKFASTIVQDTDVVRNLQDFRRPLSLHGRAREHAARGHPEHRSEQDFVLALVTRRKNDGGADEEYALNAVYGTKYRINLDHSILTDHGVFYPQALYNDLVFELTLAAAHEVVMGSDGTQLGYKLENIHMGVRGYKK